MSTSLFCEEDVIHRYTRAEAIEDGVLVGVSERGWLERHPDEDFLVVVAKSRRRRARGRQPRLPSRSPPARRRTKAS